MTAKLTNIHAFAFDLDGTLVNSAPGLTEAGQLMLRDLNLPTITEEQIKLWIGNGIDILVERILDYAAPGRRNELFEQARDIYVSHYNDVIDSGTSLYPNVLSTLLELKKRNYPLALVTNKPAQYLPDLLKSLGLEHLFSLVLGGGDVIKLKPHPAPIFSVLATFGLFSDQLFFVGDSKNDILAAKNAHCPTIALSYGYNYGEPINLTEPDFIFDDFANILTLMP